MTEIIVINVLESHKIRLRNYLKDKFEVLPSSKSIKNAIESGLVTINGKRGYTGDFVKNGDEIKYIKPTINKTVSPLELTILYEDDYIAVVVKPPGILTSGNGKITIAKCIEGLLSPSRLEDSLLAPKLIHRLDRDTNGLLIAVKTRAASIKLRHMLENHQIQKGYSAIVEGENIECPLSIMIPIDGKESHTKICTSDKLETKNPTCLIGLELLTGRTHQIRKHLAQIGYPIVGDILYNKDGVTFGKGLMLVADSLLFEHPFNDDVISVLMDLPKKFLKYI